MNARIMIGTLALLAGPQLLEGQASARAGAAVQVSGEATTARTSSRADAQVEAGGTARSGAATSAGAAAEAAESLQVQGANQARAAAAESLRVQGANQATAAAIIDATVKAGLPEAPVHRVIVQGRARGASEQQISQAALEVYARLSLARESLRDKDRPEPTSAEIAAGAEALVAGARPADLVRLHESAPGHRSLAASLTALAALASRGEVASLAAAEIAARLAANADDRTIASLAGTGTAAVDLSAAGTAGVAGASGAAAAGALDVNAAVGAGADLLGGATSIGASVAGGLGAGLR